MNELDIFQDDSIYYEKNTYNMGVEEISVLDLSDIDIRINGKLQTFPYCCGFAVYTNINYIYVEKVTNIIKNILKANHYLDYGFGAVIATVTSSNCVEKLTNNGWVLISEHENYGTGNTIYTFKFTI